MWSQLYTSCLTIPPATKFNIGFPAQSSPRLRETYYIARCCCSWPLVLLPVVQGASRTPTITALDTMAEVFSDDMNLKIGTQLPLPLHPRLSHPTICTPADRISHHHKLHTWRLLHYLPHHCPSTPAFLTPRYAPPPIASRITTNTTPGASSITCPNCPQTHKARPTDPYPNSSPSSSAGRRCIC
jgi:hypothetical protein